jgi:thymidylate kinase/nucleoside 2-deoxyribosyltransferase
MSAVVAGNPEQKKHLQDVFEHLSQKHKIMTEHIALDDVLEWEAKQPKGITVAQRDFAWLNDSDVGIIDLSWATTGGGIEAGHALDVLGIPMLALTKRGVGSSKMVTEQKHPLLEIAEYSTLEENIAITDAFLEKNSPSYTLHDKYIGWCGLDGSGKGVMNEAFIAVAREQGLKVFDSITYMNEHNALPNWEDIREEYGAILVCEPSKEGLGRLIREDLINKDNPWSSESVSQAYALNRRKLLSSLVLPALADGAWVGTDRHEISSEHYQPLHGAMWEGKSVEKLQGYVRGLEGNKLAIANPPNFFILAQIPPEVAKARLDARLDEQDNASYEKIEFMTQLAKRYSDKGIRMPYLRRGTQFLEFKYVDQQRPQTLERALNVLRTYMN